MTWINQCRVHVPRAAKTGFLFSFWNLFFIFGIGAAAAAACGQQRSHCCEYSFGGGFFEFQTFAFEIKTLSRHLQLFALHLHQLIEQRTETGRCLRFEWEWSLDTGVRLRCAVGAQIFVRGEYRWRFDTLCTCRGRCCWSRAIRALDDWVAGDVGRFRLNADNWPCCDRIGHRLRCNDARCGHSDRAARRRCRWRLLQCVHQQHFHWHTTVCCCVSGCCPRYWFCAQKLLRFEAELRRATVRLTCIRFH